MAKKARLSQEDAVAALRRQRPGTVDLILIDPAYASLEKHRSIGTTTRLKKAWFPIFPDNRYPELLEEMNRALVKNAHAYIFCDDETSDIIKPIALQAGFRRAKRLIWDKVKIGMGYRYRRQHEFILYLEKGKRRLNSNSIPDVLRYPRIHGRHRYPTEKPVELLSELILQSSSAGDVVMDVFCGSGSCGEASLRHGRRFIGSDIEDRAMRLSEQRVRQAIFRAA